MRHCENISKSSQQYDPVLGSARDWNSYDIEILVYINRDGCYDINIDTDKILYVLA